jgi:hypothetical protein
LFRDYGEAYIKTYQPSFQQIKLIRAIRLCKTPALGGHVIRCLDCDNKHYIYHSCGHSHCMICQSIKREQWVDRLRSSMLKVPYVHIVFTLPHALNGLARSNPDKMYELMLKSSWLVLKNIGIRDSYTPGMTSVLHTFGSDMKYHIHVHALVTFGGINKDNEWIFPPHKQKLEKYRAICAQFKYIFLQKLNALFQNNQLKYQLPQSELFKEVCKQRWVVHSTRPTMDTKIIEDYLAKYINRIAITNSRLNYVKENEMVSLMYNDYKQQQSGQAAPKSFKTLEPMVAIHQIMQHVLPPYFQKSRKYGLHHKSTKITKNISIDLSKNGTAIRTIIEIITDLRKLVPYQCQQCQSQNYLIEIFDPIPNFYYPTVQTDYLKSPPPNTAHITHISIPDQQSVGQSVSDSIRKQAIDI